METKKIIRRAGVLLHPTSLPGPYGIGDLGPAARHWVDCLAQSQQSWWQILPLGPAGAGDSPYQCYSAFAGNPLLISPEWLSQEGLLHPDQYASAYFPEGRVDYPNVTRFKTDLLKLAWERFQNGSFAELKRGWEAFQHEQKSWLDDYALFMALRDAQAGRAWIDWPKEYRPDPQQGNASLEAARNRLQGEIGFHQFSQFLFYRQWNQLKEYDHAKGVKLFGDIPIFVSPDSADVWRHPENFLVDREGRPKVVAGVPPDYFAQEGQLWGNPVYDWDHHEKNGFRWWIERVRACLQQVDRIRLDHFRGFCAAWHVDAQAKNAIVGKWVAGPGAKLFEAIRAELGQLPFVAEDLGEITPDVHELRQQLQLPGMKVLQFGFSSPENLFLPHNFDSCHYVVYTGTHDNDTSQGWYRTAPEKAQDMVRRYCNADGHDVAWDLIRLAWSSIAELAITPVQDLLSLGSEGRMNTPGTAMGNWQWRMQPGSFNEFIQHRLANLTALYNRTPS
jgi:4-alpha-glucanotransferase